jgi:hypothetical protein
MRWRVERVASSPRFWSSRIAGDPGNRRLLGRTDPEALLPTLVAGKVIDARYDLGVRVFAPKQCDRGQAVERVLKATAAVERAFPVVAPESAGFVVEHFERGADLVNPIDAAGDPERQSRAEIDVYWFGARQRLRVGLQGTPERDLQTGGGVETVFAHSASKNSSTSERTSFDSRSRISIVAAGISCWSSVSRACARLFSQTPSRVSSGRLSDDLSEMRRDPVDRTSGHTPMVLRCLCGLVDDRREGYEP